MKRFLAMFVATLCMLSMFNYQPVLANSSLNENYEFNDGELIISIKGDNQNELYKGSSSSDFVTAQKEALTSVGLEVLDSMAESAEAISKSGLISDQKSEMIDTMGSVYLVKYNEELYSKITDAIEDLEAKLKETGLDVNYIEPNYRVKLLDNDIVEQTTYTINTNQAWHYNMINVQTAWNITTGGSNVKIAVLDTGIDYDHSNLANYVDMTLAKAYEGTSVNDVHGHGTHVSGTIASYGTVSGVMRNAKIIPVRVLDDDGYGDNYNIAQAIIYAADCDADVINMSLGGGSYSSTMYNAVQYAVNNNTVVVAASGNSGTSSISYPAKYANVIAVGAVNSSRVRASFSQYGTGLDIMAPGVSIYSTYLNNAYTTMSGTSMATPHITGVVGLMRAANSSLSVAQVESIMKSTAQYAGSSTQYGSGIVDAGAAVTQAYSLAAVQNQQNEYYVLSNSLINYLYQ